MALTNKTFVEDLISAVNFSLYTLLEDMGFGRDLGEVDGVDFFGESDTTPSSASGYDNRANRTIRVTVELGEELYRGSGIMDVTVSIHFTAIDKETSPRFFDMDGAIQQWCMSSGMEADLNAATGNSNAYIFPSSVRFVGRQYQTEGDGHEAIYIITCKACLK